MSTTSTVPAVVDGFLAAVAAELDVDTYESWPGPEASREMFILSDVEWEDYTIPTIMAGRRQRQEDWSIGFEVWVVGGAGSTPSNVKPARDRAFEILSGVEDVLAEDVTGGTDHATVQHVQLRPTEAGPRVNEGGWAYRVAGRVEVRARLT